LSSIKDFLKYFRFLLLPFSLLYGLIISLRNRLYDVGVLSSVGFGVPVIAVGNLSTGGTGKTPHIEYLIELMRYHYKVATMSRGYKRITRGFLLANHRTNAFDIGDEPMQFKSKYPEVQVSVCEERMIGIPMLMQADNDIDVILLDDAFQHRSVKPGLNILITDYSHRFTKDFILPFGNLREGRSAYKRADVIIVSKCPPQLGMDEKEAIRREIQPSPNQELYFSTLAYGTMYDLFTREEVNITPETGIVLACGIANPDGLYSYLTKLTPHVHLLQYPDHHYFSQHDLNEMQQAYDNMPQQHKLLLTTEKDAVRLLLKAQQLHETGMPVAVLPVKVQLLFNESDTFNHKIFAFVEEKKAAFWND
jgi:tetraacyldisaccharide 4'-kinase